MRINLEGVYFHAAYCFTNRYGDWVELTGVSLGDEVVTFYEGTKEYNLLKDCTESNLDTIAYQVLS